MPSCSSSEGVHYWGACCFDGRPSDPVHFVLCILVGTVHGLVQSIEESVLLDPGLGQQFKRQLLEADCDLPGAHGVIHLQPLDHVAAGGGVVLVFAHVRRDVALHSRPIRASVLFAFEFCTKNKLKC